MNKYVKIILVLAVIGVIVALYVWFFVYNKPHRDYAAATPDRYVDAETLYYDFRQDKALGDSLYTGLILQVNGALNKVEHLDSTAIAVFVFEQGLFGDEGIRCIFIPGFHDDLSDYSPGDEILIKGYCTGYNETDVIIEKATIVTKE